MSGSANNLPVRITLDGAEEFSRKLAQIAEDMKRPVQAAEQMAPAVARAADSFGALEARTKGVAGNVRDLRGAMELLGASSAAGSLGTVASMLGNVADVFSAAGAAASRFNGVAAVLSSRLVTLASIAAVPLFLQSVGLGINSAGTAAEDASTAIDRYRAALERLAPTLEENARKEREAAIARAQGAAATIEAEFGQLLESRGAGIGRINELEGRLVRQQRVLTDAQGNLTEFDRIGRGTPAQRQSMAAEVERTQQAIARINAELTQLRTQWAGVDANAEFNAGQGRINSLFEPFHLGPFQPGDPRFFGEQPGRSGGRGSGLPDPGATIYESAPAGQTVFPLFGLADVEDRNAQARARAEEQARQAREREEQQTLRRIEQANERTTDNIVRYAGDAFADMFQNTAGGWDQMLARFRQTAIQTFARIAAEAVIRPIIAPIVSSLGLGGLTGGSGGAGGLGDVLGIGSSLAGLGNTLGLGSIFGTSGGLTGGFIGNALAAPLFGSGALSSATSSALGAMGGAYGPATASQLGLGGATFGSVLGPAALGFMGGSLLAGLTGGNTTGGGIGGALGAGVGSLLGPVGAIAGGALGGALGGLFGPSNTTPFWGAEISADNGLLGLRGSGGKRDNGQLNALLAQTQQQLAAVNAVLVANGIEVSGATMLGSDPADPGRPADLGAAFSRFRFSSRNANLNTAVGGRGFGSLDELSSTAQWVTQVYNVLVEAGKPADAFAEQLKAINAQFDAATARARELGLSEAELAAARTRSLAAAEEARSNAAAGQVVGQVTNLADYVRGLRVANDSPLAPLGRLAAARGDFFRQADAVERGDLAALSRVTGSAQAFLSVSRDVNGSGTGFAADFSAALGRLESLGGLSTDALTASVYVAEQRSLVDVLRDEMGRLRAEVAGLRADQAQGNRMPARLAA